MPDNSAQDLRSQSPQSVARVIHILEALCDSDAALSLADLSRILASPKSSVAALLRGLAEAGFVATVDGAWRLGPGAFGLGAALTAARRRLQSSDLVRDGMHRLVAQSGETVLFAVADADGQTLTYVDMVESPNPVCFAVSLGDRRPLYCTAGGRALLAALPEATLDAYLSELEPTRLTGQTETSTQALADAVADARVAGVAQTVDQAADGVTGTAALIRDAAGEVLGALVIAAPTPRWEGRRSVLAELVRAEAGKTSRSFGYRPAFSS